ncbi:uncharacterized protein BXZ73DRAFT_108256 [Epithele typhae]|uniref:uncharacterized protein n=1 Tax=Epithele typhae TaxID=378194 RepID=UPI0020073AB2|nr:uncharacterized protein BXZ73DRAFT_108256 [Epithele typhae]KAH9911099.1 hypothetical protein BXZ73DRAFT_108256 [Epithele typhae]
MEEGSPHTPSQPSPVRPPPKRTKANKAREERGQPYPQATPTKEAGEKHLPPRPGSQSPTAYPADPHIAPPTLPALHGELFTPPQAPTGILTPYGLRLPPPTPPPTPAAIREPAPPSQPLLSEHPTPLALPHTHPSTPTHLQATQATLLPPSEQPPLLLPAPPPWRTETHLLTQQSRNPPPPPQEDLVMEEADMLGSENGEERAIGVIPVFDPENDPYDPTRDLARGAGYQENPHLQYTRQGNVPAEPLLPHPFYARGPFPNIHLPLYLVFAGCIADFQTHTLSEATKSIILVLTPHGAGKGWNENAAATIEEIKRFFGLIAFDENNRMPYNVRIRMALRREPYHESSTFAAPHSLFIRLPPNAIALRDHLLAQQTFGVSESKVSFSITPLDAGALVQMYSRLLQSALERVLGATPEHGAKTPEHAGAACRAPGSSIKGYLSQAAPATLETLVHSGDKLFLPDVVVAQRVLALEKIKQIARADSRLKEAISEGCQADFPNDTPPELVNRTIDSFDLLRNTYLNDQGFTVAKYTLFVRPPNQLKVDIKIWKAIWSTTRYHYISLGWDNLAALKPPDLATLATWPRKPGMQVTYHATNTTQTTEEDSWQLLQQPRHPLGNGIMAASRSGRGEDAHTARGICYKSAKIKPPHADRPSRTKRNIAMVLMRWV